MEDISASCRMKHIIIDGLQLMNCRSMEENIFLLSRVDRLCQKQLKKQESFRLICGMEAMVQLISLLKRTAHLPGEC